MSISGISQGEYYFTGVFSGAFLALVIGKRVLTSFWTVHLAFLLFLCGSCLVRQNVRDPQKLFCVAGALGGFLVLSPYSVFLEPEIEALPKDWVEDAADGEDSKRAARAKAALANNGVEKNAAAELFSLVSSMLTEGVMGSHNPNTELYDEEKGTFRSEDDPAVVAKREKQQKLKRRVGEIIFTTFLGMEEFEEDLFESVWAPAAAALNAGETETTVVLIAVEAYAGALHTRKRRWDFAEFEKKWMREQEVARKKLNVTDDTTKSKEKSLGGARGNATVSNEFSAELSALLLAPYERFSAATSGASAVQLRLPQSVDDASQFVRNATQLARLTAFSPAQNAYFSFLEDAKSARGKVVWPNAQHVGMGLFQLFVVLFHLPEFFFVVTYHPRDVTFQSFMLNPVPLCAYTVALLAAAAEHWFVDYRSMAIEVVFSAEEENAASSTPSSIGWSLSRWLSSLSAHLGVRKAALPWLAEHALQAWKMASLGGEAGAETAGKSLTQLLEAVSGASPAPSSSSSAGGQLLDSLFVKAFMTKKAFFALFFDCVWDFVDGLRVRLAVLLTACGLFLRISALMTAKANFTHEIQYEKRANHDLVVSGVYCWCRHPSYLGWTLWSLGTQVLLGNPVCFLLYTLVVYRFFSRRIQEEEELLLDFFGEEYLKYAMCVPCGLPFMSRLTNSYRILKDKDGEGGITLGEAKKRLLHGAALEKRVRGIALDERVSQDGDGGVRYRGGGKASA